MKKYFRTKDIVNLSEKVAFDSTGHAYSKLTNCYCDFTKTEITEEADTIEELCDSLVLICEHDIHIEWPFKGNKETIFEDFKNTTEIDLGFGWYVKVLERFAGIWTNNGLKYVAKLNNNNHLVLTEGL